ncbi:hypothetical protein PI95_033520 [Hassallia byssoidea VB512170]|uniref:Uncharacterized protein n=1 Tax=Hassallia byssoidea VB512170 TaxID=1304833 RepID=A0A846HIU0_9CYAN|nr:hypothetical protein [Hassalia byssoidea]NEU77275.1 hypothetical protein [Hassalia byssoidea VB512170]
MGSGAGGRGQGEFVFSSSLSPPSPLSPLSPISPSPPSSLLPTPHSPLPRKYNLHGTKKSLFCCEK